ncbi:hypothetical protein ACFC08_34300 [Streptomyces sp. NPDC056112]|uniref:hypothetical protein n=1 Tax=Streptomyces sp. NPDC056112 TaxID=3345715 RepID=UPI0035D5BF5E
MNHERGLLIGFQRVDDYRAAGRPDQTVPQQLHICFKVVGLDEAWLLEMGAAASRITSRMRTGGGFSLDVSGDRYGRRT